MRIAQLRQMAGRKPGVRGVDATAMLGAQFV
jgi:hypothetical protein